MVTVRNRAPLSGTAAANVPVISQDVVNERMEVTLHKMFVYDDNDTESYSNAVRYIEPVKAFLDDERVKTTRVSHSRLHLLMRLGEYVHCMTGQPENAVPYFE
jgi:hypothetical protein